MKKLILFLFASFLLFSCGDDSGKGGKNFNEEGSGVFICNEGMYSGVTGSLSYYDPETKSVDNDIYDKANGVPIGKVCQSMSIIDGKGFVVVTGANKVVVMDPVTFKHLGSVTGLPAPKEVAAVSSEKLYVRDQNRPFASVVGRKDYGYKGPVLFPDNSASLKDTRLSVTVSNFYYVFDWVQGNQVYKIDTQSDMVVDSITVTYQPNSIVIDKNNKLWVLSDGGYEDPIFGGYKVIPALTRINLATFTIEKTFLFPDKTYAPEKLTLNGKKDMLYFVNSGWGSGASNAGVYAMSINSNELPALPFIPEGNIGALYGLGVDPANSDIYISDAVDYTQSGVVYRYSSTGQLLDSFTVGVCPGSFCFKPE